MKAADPPAFWLPENRRWTPKNQPDKKTAMSKLYSDVVMKVHKDLEVVDTQGQCHGMVPKRILEKASDGAAAPLVQTVHH